jgi:CBS domain-containing protein
VNAGDLCKRDVIVAYKDMPLTEAARVMRERHVGSVVVVVDRASERVPVGILTDRDIVVAVVAKGLDPRTLKVGDVMSGGLFVVREQDDPAEVLRAMRDNGVRRVPVVTHSGALAGILAVDDLLELMSDELIDFVRTFARERVRESRLRRP